MLVGSEVAANRLSRSRSPCITRSRISAESPQMIVIGIQIDLQAWPGEPGRGLARAHAPAVVRPERRVGYGVLARRDEFEDLVHSGHRVLECTALGGPIR